MSSAHLYLVLTLTHDTAVYIFKKALFLIHAINLRFTPSEARPDPSPIPVPDTRTLPIFADNVIPSMLVHLGVLDLSEANIGNLKTTFVDTARTLDSLLAVAPLKDNTKEKVPPTEGPRLAPEEAYTLRAAAVDACEIIIAAAKDIVVPENQEKQSTLRSITLPQLDAWLWAVAKDREDYRSLPRFVERPTPFY